MPLAAVAAALLARSGPGTGRPTVIAVDGRQGGGKTTFCSRLAEQVPGAAVVHTDDVAWWESFFGWDHLMSEGILQPLRRGEGVSLRPPAWISRGRAGAIEVAATVPVVLVEGVGASRESLAPFLDAAVWVQSDYEEAVRRGIERDGGTAEHAAFWHEWASVENPFLAADRPWERATVVVCGTPDLVTAAANPTQVLVGRSLRAVTPSPPPSGVTTLGE